MRNNSSQDSAVNFGADYTYDGMGRMVRERIWRWDQMIGRIVTTQDTKYTFDLAGNTTQIVFSDNAGFAYEETRTYARGYQLINANVGRYAADVSVSTSGSYTYDTNNNLLTTKKIDITRNGTQLAYRDSWTFAFDRKNRLTKFKQSWNDNETHISYDGLGRVWQRWEYDTVGEEWASTLKRFVYDGNALSQEIETAYEEEVYSYTATAHDFLRKPDGIRDKADTGSQVYEDRYLLTDKGQITARVKRETTSAVVRQELTVSGERQAGGSTQDAQISNLGIGGGYIEGYGGGSSDPDTKYFDPLVQYGGRHYLPGLDFFLSRIGNNAYKNNIPKQDSSPGPIISGLQQLREQCGDDCYNFTTNCLRIHVLAGGSYDFMYQNCCGIALCIMSVDWEDPEELWVWMQCRNCICGSEVDRLCGTQCICDELRKMGYPNHYVTIAQHLKDYFYARNYCKAKCAPCSTLPMYAIPHYGNFNTCPEHFSYPWPSCYEICMAGEENACLVSMGVCFVQCARYYANNAVALADCYLCCERAAQECTLYVNEGNCDWSATGIT